MKITPLAKAQLAYAQLDKYLREMISKERVAIESGGTVKSRGPTGNLLQSVLQSSYDYVQQGEQQKTEEKTKKHGFTENEVLGNLFIFLLAGELHMF
jgi:cytochrome P450